MLTEEDLRQIEGRLEQLAAADRSRLERLRAVVREWRGRVRRIDLRTTTAIALVATDAGENALAFDPHLFWPVRVVDSGGRVWFRDVLTPWMDVEELNRQHWGEDGAPVTALGRLMQDLGVAALWELSPMIPDPGTAPERRSRSWLQVYRDLGEWAVLYELVTQRDFGTDTLIVRDGWLRSKIFAGNLFTRMWERMGEAADRAWRRDRRRIYVVGIMKRSRLLDRYRLALLLEGVVAQPGACYVPVPPEVEREVYRWEEIAPGEGEEGAFRRFVAGRLFLVKFGEAPHDPIYAVDMWERHERRGEVGEVFGYLLGDARVGFPRPFYPLCLQRAHAHARLGGLDAELLQDLVMRVVERQLLPDRPQALGMFRLMGGGYGE